MTTTPDALLQERKAAQLLELCATGSAPEGTLIRRLDASIVRRVLLSNGFAYVFLLGLVALIPVAIPTKGNLAGQLEAMFLLWLIFTTTVVGVSIVPLQRWWNRNTALLVVGGGILAIRDRGSVYVWDLGRLRPEVTAYTQQGKVRRIAVWNDRSQAETVLNHEAFGDLNTLADALTAAIRAATKR